MVSCLLFPAADAAVPPWVGYNEEEVMRTQILALSGVSCVLACSLTCSSFVCQLLRLTFTDQL